MAEPATILIIEDEPHMRTLLQVTLKGAGYRCLNAGNGTDGVAAALKFQPSVVLLDLGLPDIDGVEATRRIRERSAMPIIAISARSHEDQKIRALDGGANDYVTKPFGVGELLARIRVALRTPRDSTEAKEEGSIRIGDLVVDFGLRRVTVGDTEVRLTATEYRLLGVLVRSAGRVLTHDFLLREVWGPGFATQGHYLRVYMKKLRYKIEAEPAQPRYLINEPGVGYRLKVPN